MNQLLSTAQGKFIVRKLEKTDGQMFFQLMESNRQRLANYFPVTSKNTATASSTTSYLKLKVNQMRERKFFGFIVHEKESASFAAYLLFKNIDWKVPKCEIAYMIDQQFSKKGLMIKFVQTVCTYAYETLKMVKIYALVSEQNPASRKVIQKSGFKEKGYLSHEYRSGSGHLENVYRYALINESIIGSPIPLKA